MDEYENFLVITADNHETRIYLVAAKGVEEEETIHGRVKNKVKKGGWSQKRYARKRKSELRHYAKEVLETLERLDQEEYLAGHPAALGPEDVLLAILNGRVESLIINSGVRLEGIRCSECENIAAGTPHACPYCQARDLLQIDLVNELVRQAEMSDADLEFAEPISGLTQAGHVAALLRY